MADLVRLWTTNPGGTVSNRSIAPGAPFQVVLDVEAETAEFAIGATYATGAIAINRTTGVASGALAPVAPGTPPYGAPTPMGAPQPTWNTELDQFRWTVPAGFGAANDIIELFAFVRVGAGPSVETHFASTYLIRA